MSGNSDALVAQFTMLDVGHGTCCVLAQGSAICLFDAGPGATVLEYLKQSKITRIDDVFISHADTDHIRGLILLLGSDMVKIGRVHINSDGMKSTEIWRSLTWELDQASSNGRVVVETQLRRGQQFTWLETDVSVEVLAPRSLLVLRGPGSKDQADRRTTSNTLSAVLHLKSVDASLVLMMGDLDRVGLDNLLEADELPQADVLVFPHHGGTPGSSRVSEVEQFARDVVTRVNPKLVLFSVARGHYDLPRREVVAAVLEADRRTDVACSQLSRTCAEDPIELRGDHLLPVVSAGSSQGCCCAGTVQIGIYSGGRWQRAGQREHHDFVHGQVAHPMCLL